MEAGKLRHRIELQEDVAETPGEFGDLVPIWVTKQTRWASVRPATGKEIFRAQQTQGQIDIAIDMRGKLPLLRPKWRIKFGTRTFGIAAPPIDHEERGIRITLLCKEGPRATEGG